MARERKGSILTRKNGSIWARVTFVETGSGKRREKARLAKNRTEARAFIKEMLRDIDDNGEQAIEASRMTFNHTAAYYEKHYLIAPVYRDGRKVAGLRSYRDGLTHMRTLRDHFGRYKLRALTYGNIERFKAERLATPTRYGQPRTLASVHRELALLRSTLHVAKREGWITRNPFNAGKPLINVADECKRERILTREEEARLLAACTGPRAHLRPLLLAALDTGMRQGELFKLRWRDIDFPSRTITVQAFNTKTLKERQVALTIRLVVELEALFAFSTKSTDALIFNIKDNVSKSFTAVRRVAGMMDLRFHDLRHTAATRLVQGHLPLSEVGRILGHTTPGTTYRYVNANAETAQRAAAIMDAYHADNCDMAQGLEMLN